MRSGFRVRPADALPLAVVLALVWIGSSIPPQDFPDARIWDYDKLLHVGEYGVVGLALAFALRNLPLTTQRRILYIVGMGLAWAVSDELHQAFVGRDCSLGDLFADLSGLLVAAWISPRLPGFRRNRGGRPSVGLEDPSPPASSDAASAAGEAQVHGREHPIQERSC